MKTLSEVVAAMGLPKEAEWDLLMVWPGKRIRSVRREGLKAVIVSPTSW